MKIEKRFGIIVGAVLLLSALLTGAAFAHGGGIPSAEKIQALVEAGKLTQGEADVVVKLSDLRRSFMEKLKAESKVITEQAVAEGKITQEQADRLLSKGGRLGHGKGTFFGRGHGPRGMSLEDHKAHWIERGTKTN